MITGPTPFQCKPYTRQTIFLARQWQWMSAHQQETVQVVSHVLPFRTSQFVLDQLIDWPTISDDPIFRLTFRQRDMLPAHEYAQLRKLVLFNLMSLVKGLSSSLAVGKMAIEGITCINGEKLFALRFLAARNADWPHWTFFARFDPGAAWCGNVIPIVPPARRDVCASDARLELA